MNAFTIPAKSPISQAEERTAAAKRKGGLAASKKPANRFTVATQATPRKQKENSNGKHEK
jgi:hypothetical protein